MLVSLYDKSLTDPTVKALSTSGIDLTCTVEDKFINIKLSSSKKEIQERIN